MKYTVCENFEWTYPDVHSYATSSDSASIHALRGSVASFQIHIYDCVGDVSAVCDIKGAELYEEIAIPVESCPGIEENEKRPHFPEREAPFYVNDCLKPYCGKMHASPSCTLYVAVSADESGELIGTVSLSDDIDTAEVPVRVSVSEAFVPGECLEILMGFSRHCMRINHGIKDNDEYLRMEDEYLTMLRRMHQNRLYIDPPGMRRGENGIEFDFTDMDRYVEKALSFGFHSFHLPDVGHRRSWEEGDILIGRHDYRSPEAMKFLTEYLSALREHIRQKGWTQYGMFSIGISDEPNELNTPAFVELSHIVKALIPEMTVYDAVADTDIDDASIDIWVPRCDEFERGFDRFEKIRKRGGEMWQYVCLFPRARGYVNRFMDIPLLQTRYLYWGNFRYSLSGYLHWTVNDYQSGCDPFTASCPVHINAGSKSILPPGDDKLIYPGEGHPWMSMRLENHRESAEEYAMLCVLAENNKDTAMRICKRAVRSFCDTELNAAVFKDIRRELIEEYEKISRNL